MDSAASHGIPRTSSESTARVLQAKHRSSPETDMCRVVLLFSGPQADDAQLLADPFSSSIPCRLGRWGLPPVALSTFRVALAICRVERLSRQCLLVAAAYALRLPSWVPRCLHCPLMCDSGAAGLQEQRHEWSRRESTYVCVSLQRYIEHIMSHVPSVPFSESTTFQRDFPGRRTRKQRCPINRESMATKTKITTK